MTPDLISNPEEGARIIADDLSIFADLDERTKRRVYAVIKAYRPHPEFKKDFEWVLGWMKEEVDAIDKQDPLSAKEQRMELILKLRDEGLTLKKIGAQVGVGGFRVGELIRQHIKNQDKA